ncbi:hypothetical protein BU23DRAFT_96034 [Bimuria novae-zelandiae CBS 107.79]|uniref:Uncharacterized protein n=1 Tax=Bimuria novae-zelandiae CBS 107.79 TaxID=1447943 RepID=A0A6A5VDZ9_9PLEO|nr:hypothetical protein BU23DRAFT_96034 [Bimuria novae-zelandiae CBS 107.79]
MLFHILLHAMDSAGTKLNSFEVIACVSAFDCLQSGYMSHSLKICLRAWTLCLDSLFDGRSRLLPLVRRCEAGDSCAEHYNQAMIDQPEVMLIETLNRLRKLKVTGLEIIDTQRNYPRRPHVDAVERDRQLRTQIGQSLPKFSLPDLELFVLKYAIADEVNLRVIYMTHSSTLERLIFDNVEIREGTWKSFCT